MRRCISETRGSRRNGRSRSIVLAGPASPHRRPAAFEGTGPPRSRRRASGTGGKKPSSTRKPLASMVGKNLQTPSGGSRTQMSRMSVAQSTASHHSQFSKRDAPTNNSKIGRFVATFVLPLSSRAGFLSNRCFVSKNPDATCEAPSNGKSQGEFRRQGFRAQQHRNGRIGWKKTEPNCSLF